MTLTLIPRPSGLHLTVPCPGSLQLQASTVPPPKTYEQAEGTGAHLVALKHANGAAAEFPLGRKFMQDGHELEVDDDMIDGAALYAGEAQLHSTARFEDPVAIPDVHATCAGTPDYWRLIVETYLKLLKVIDYKYGHRFVEPFENYQLLAYVAGVARFLNLPLDFPVMLVVVQPRAYSGPGPVREWTTTVGRVYELCATLIAPKVALALGPNPPTVTGRHCEDCTARHVCRTLQHETSSIVDFSGTAELAPLSNEAMGQELRIIKDAIKRLEARYTGLYAQAAFLGKAGKPIPFWNMEPTKGKLGWMTNTTVETVGAMGDLLGIETRKPATLKTPTQVIAAGIDEAIVLQYAERPRGAMRLVQDDATALRKIFQGNTTV